MLRFDPRTQESTLVGGELPGDYKWVGGVLAADGNIYGIPFKARASLPDDAVFTLTRSFATSLPPTPHKRVLICGMYTL